jgi:hypothetical protein
LKEKLDIELELSIGGHKHAIPGGNVRGFSLRLESWGVSGWIEFVQQDDKRWGGKYEDELLSDFVKPDLGEVTLSIQPGHLETQTKSADAKIATGGVVLERSVREEAMVRVMADPAVLFRRYRVTFADPAQALWRQHFPCALYTQRSFKDVVEAHKGDKISLTYDWTVITTPVPLIFFHLDPAARSSFYDLVFWYVSGRNGFITFDHETRTYTIAAAKDTGGQAAELSAEDLASMTSVLPEVPRHKPRVLCSFAESPRTEVIDNPHAAAGIWKDNLMRSPIARDVDDRVTLDKARPLLLEREVELSFRRFPTIRMAPGALCDISSKGGHSEEIVASNEPFRVFFLSLEARALHDRPEASYGEPAADFTLECSARLEQQSEPFVRLPPIVAPRFPAHLEGKVVSEVGPETDITYEFRTDSATSLDLYRIEIPLFGCQQVNALYEPESGAGNLYLPLYKKQRVLVAFDFGRAWVARMLDWRADARVPKDGQGQHLFLGKSAQSNTSMLHDYQAEKPVFRVLRTNGSDTELVKLSEGNLLIKVEG